MTNCIKTGIENDGWMEIATDIFENFSEKTQTERQTISEYLLTT